MKKLLIFMLVLGMTSWASASMVMDISVNGDPTPDATYTLAQPPLKVSDNITLDIKSVSGFMPGDGEYFALLTLPARGTITGGAYVGPASLDASSVLGDFTKGDESGQLYTVDAYSGTATGAAGVYFDEILLHIEGHGKGPTINLYGTVTGDEWRLVDSVTIIPEPATIMLLGLGGLLLRRRK